MRFEVIEYGFHKPAERRFGVEQTSHGPAVLELTIYNSHSLETSLLLYTEREANYLCALMNELFAFVNVETETEDYTV